MIYIDKTKKIGKFPKISNDSFNRIEFINQVTNKKITFETNDKGNGLIYNIDLSSIIDEFEPGQYDYYFYNSANDVVNSGILQFGDFEADLVEYSHEKNIIQYN